MKDKKLQREYQKKPHWVYFWSWCLLQNGADIPRDTHGRKTIFLSQEISLQNSFMFSGETLCKLFFLVLGFCLLWAHAGPVRFLSEFMWGSALLGADDTAPWSHLPLLPLTMFSLPLIDVRVLRAEVWRRHSIKAQCSCSEVLLSVHWQVLGHCVTFHLLQDDSLEMDEWCTDLCTAICHSESFAIFIEENDSSRFS